MKSPYYKVLIGNKDYSEFISELSFDDSMIRDSLLTLKIYPEKAIDFLNNKDIKITTDVSFSFGFILGDVSRTHLAKIAAIDAKYDSSGITVTIKALDAGNYLKKNSDNQIFTNLTSSQIARKIADQRGLNCEIDETTEIWDNMPQKNLSDVHFLQTLCNLEDDFVCYIRSGTLYFKKRALDSASELTYTYFNDDRFISFSPKETTLPSEGSSSKVKIGKSNPYTGEQSVLSVTPETKSSQTTLNKYDYIYDTNSNLINKVIKNDPGRSKTIIKKTQSDSEALNIANSVSKKDSNISSDATLVVEGNPLLTPKAIITLAGLSNRHIGNWQIYELKHRLSSSNFTTNIELLSNGNNLQGIKAKNSNKSVGPSKKQQTKSIYTYDVNSKEL